MASIISRRWSGDEQVTLQRAVANPTFQSFMLENGFSLPQLQNWIRAQDVPASYRASLRAALNAWVYSQAGAW